MDLSPQSSFPPLLPTKGTLTFSWNKISIRGSVRWWSHICYSWPARGWWLYHQDRWIKRKKPPPPFYPPISSISLLWIISGRLILFLIKFRTKNEEKNKKFEEELFLLTVLLLMREESKPIKDKTKYDQHTQIKWWLWETFISIYLHSIKITN